MCLPDFDVLTISVGASVSVFSAFSRNSDSRFYSFSKQGAIANTLSVDSAQNFYRLRHLLCLFEWSEVRVESKIGYLSGS